MLAFRRFIRFGKPQLAPPRVQLSGFLLAREQQTTILDYWPSVSEQIFGVE